MAVFLINLQKQYPEISINHYEIYHNTNNRTLFLQRLQKANIAPKGVPTVFIGQEVFTGYAQQIKSNIQNIVDSLLLKATHQEQKSQKHTSFHYYSRIGNFAIIFFIITLCAGLIAIFIKKRGKK
jgi:hypothetical protein